MADSDKSLDLLIRILAQTFGATEAQSALDKVKTEAKDTGTEYAGLTEETKKYIKRMEEEGSESLSLKEKKHALHMVLHSLGPEYAGLAQISKFFFNPALLATAGLVAATELYKKRIEEMTSALAGVQLPDLEPHIKQLSTATQLSRDYEAALGGILQKYNSIESQTARALDADAKNLDLKHKQIEAQKQYALTLLESQKEQLTPEQYQRRKAEVEHNANAAIQAEETKSKRLALEQESLEAHRLHDDAARKRTEAGGIKVASPETDAENKKERDKQTEAARKTIEESQGWINKIGAMRDSWGEFTKGFLPYALRYGRATGSEALGLEHENINEAREIIKRNEEAAARQPARDELRERRKSLTTESAQEEGKAREIDASLPGKRRLQAASEQVSNFAENQRYIESMVKTLPSAGASQGRVLDLLGKLADANQLSSRRMDNLEAQIRNAGNHGT